MRIACLQFAPQVGDVDNNLNRADAVLSKANPQDLDLLVLPELAFSGYNFKSLQHISPYLEPSAAGITSLWARTTALKYDCIVHVGYPEKVDVAKKWPTSPEYYNSTITINPDGETIGHYRKSHLYYTDETWALEGPEGFFGDEVEGLGNVAMGIFATAHGTNLGMDLNPYKFEAPWHAHEFAYHILHKHSNLVILSLAWLTREESRSFTRTPKEPDLETLSYWMDRLEPIIRAEAEGEIIVVFANRTGMEDEAVYAGTSAVLGIHNGEVKVYGILGRGEKELLVVDTSKPPKAKLVSERNAPKPAPTSASSSSTAATASSTSQEVGEPISPDTDAEECYYWTNDSTFSVIQKNGILSIDDHGEASEMDLNVVSDSSSLWSSTQRPEPKRPESPKSRNASRSGQRELRERALVSHDLAEELQPVVHPVDANAPPHSASPSWTDPNSKKRDSLGPRSRHVSPRPKSTVW